MGDSVGQRSAIAFLCVVALGIIGVLFGTDGAVFVGVFVCIVTFFMVLAEPIRKRAEMRLRERRKAELRAMRRGGP